MKHNTYVFSQPAQVENQKLREVLVSLLNLLLAFIHQFPLFEIKFVKTKNRNLHTLTNLDICVHLLFYFVFSICFTSNIPIFYRDVHTLYYFIYNLRDKRVKV